MARPSNGIAARAKAIQESRGVSRATAYRLAQAETNVETNVVTNETNLETNACETIVETNPETTSVFVSPQAVAFVTLSASDLLLPGFPDHPFAGLQAVGLYRDGRGWTLTVEALVDGNRKTTSSWHPTFASARDSLLGRWA